MNCIRTSSQSYLYLLQIESALELVHSYLYLLEISSEIELAHTALCICWRLEVYYNWLTK